MATMKAAVVHATRRPGGSPDRVATAAVSTEDDADGRSFRTVPKASCGEEDNPETALQGQVPAALRVSGFGGFSCNLKLIGQVRGDGANWQSAEFKAPSDSGRMP
jgi:hypothetical protein